MAKEKKRWLIVMIGIVLCAVFTMSCSDDDDDGSSTGPSTETMALKIGALFSFEETGPIHGQSMLAALETAESDINRYLENSKSTNSVEFVAEDTHGSISELRGKLNTLIEDGITVIFTPLTSFELDILASDAQGKDVVFISPTSTSTGLSLDDNLVRLLPDDTVQASMTADVLTADGIKKLITLYRSDLWGSRLSEDLASAFSAGGGNVELSLAYSARVPDSETENVIAQAAAAVTKALETADATQVAVHISCFEEGVNYLKEAAKYPDLAKVKWYSADGFAKNAALLEDSEVAAFAATTALSASQFGEPANIEYSDKQEKIAEKTGITPYSPAMLLYDCAWIAAKAADSTDMKHTDAYKTKLLEIAATHEGLFGKARMNGNGDRANGSFDFWTVTGSEGAYSWEKSATYQVGE